MKSVGSALLFAVVAAACSTSNDDTPDPGAGLLAANPNGADTGGECSVGNDCKSGICTGSSCANNPTDIYSTAFSGQPSTSAIDGTPNILATALSHASLTQPRHAR